MNRNDLMHATDPADELTHARLRSETGRDADEIKHFERPRSQPFLARERSDTTILFGGLTEAHEELIVAAMQRLGYRVERLPAMDFTDLLAGKEFCNRGQCNPTYYTAGNLVRYLQELRRRMSIEEIERRYVFLTAGSCGPCRFGMYESEYRKAVVEAGFTNFRIVLFQQDGLGQSGGDGDRAAGVDLDRRFVVALLRCIIIGDLINGVVDKIRPYETEPGATLDAKARTLALMQNVLRSGGSVIAGLRRSRRIFADVRCDFTRVKPVVKITGEIWASLTEGQGNYHLKSWLVEEGAEVQSAPLTTWAEHLLYSREITARNHRRIKQDDRGIGKGTNPYLQELKLLVLRRTLNAFYNLYRGALGWRADNTVNNRTLARCAHHYYNQHQGGGEAYMEVGSLVHSARQRSAHMMVSVKPFGCMPSTASDGVQTKVMADHPHILFLPLETSGDSEVSFKSRAQMVLFEAKQKAREEAEGVIEKYNIDPDAVREFVRRNPRFASGMFRCPTTVTGTGASFLLAMHQRMHKRGARPA